MLLIHAVGIRSSGLTTSKEIILKALTSIKNGNIEKIVCIFLKKLSNCFLMMQEKIKELLSESFAEAE